jgi:hypothetical protein
MMARRLLLISICTIASLTPLTWVDGAISGMHAVYDQVRGMTGVSIPSLTKLFTETNVDDEGILQVPVPSKTPDIPSVRLDLRGCTPRHLEAINDFIDVCHSKAGRPRRRASMRTCSGWPSAPRSRSSAEKQP